MSDQKEPHVVAQIVIDVMSDGRALMRDTTVPPQAMVNIFCGMIPQMAARCNVEQPKVIPAGAGALRALPKINGSEG